MIEKEKKIWTIDEIRELLKSNDNAVIRGLLTIYAFQTYTEQETENTSEHNGVGFTGVDGGILSSFAKGYKKYGKLSVKQMAIARNKMPKYAKQLTRVANKEIKVPTDALPSNYRR